MSKTDVLLKQQIDQELEWDPKVNPALIGVTVDHGAVSLLGTVDTYAQRWAAEDAVKRVSGVRTVAQDLTVKVLDDHVRNDSEIATAVQNTLTWDVIVPKAVSAVVRGSVVTLEGEVTWNFQREAAVRAIRYITGISSVRNLISLKPSGASAAQVKEKVEAALHRQATTDANSIHVDTAGGKVTLTGRASSWQTIEDAANAAWAAHGVTEVIDHVKLQMSP
jgi:osmotically-inducible protein OsmY